MEIGQQRKEKDEIYNFICSLESREIKGGTINSIQYQGIPIWWFCKVRFMRDLLPVQFDNFSEIACLQKKSILQRRLHTLFKKRYARLLAWTLFFNESLKRRIVQKRNRKSGEKKEREEVIQTAGSAAEKNKNRKKNVVFLTHTSAIKYAADRVVNIDRIDPVFKNAQKDEELAVQVVVMDALSSVFRPWSQRLVESPNLIHANINKKECIETLRTGTILESAWKRFKQNLTTVLSKKEKELFFLLEPGLDFFFSRHTIAVTLMYYEVFKKIFVEKQADAVVMYASGMTLERTAIQAAHTLHIPSIRLMHGLALSNTKWTYPDMFYVLSNNELEKKQYIQLGAPAKSIVVTGPIFLHNIKRYLKMKKQPNKQPHILFCTAPMIAENVIEKSRYFSYIQKFLAELKDVNGGRCTVKIKLHPLEKEGEEYRKIIQELQAPNINIVEGMEKNVLYGLIHECDAFVSFFSTTISEANLLGRLTILIDLYDHYFVDRFGIYFRNTEAVLKADPDTPAGTLRTLVEKVLFDESMRKDLASKRAKFVRLFFYKKDGRAPERAVKNIKKIIEENHSNHC